MDVSYHLKSDILKHLPLAPVRLAGGSVILVGFLSPAFMVLVWFTPPLIVFLQPFSVHQSKEATSLFLWPLLALWPYLFEKINDTRLDVLGEFRFKKRVS